MSPKALVALLFLSLLLIGGVASFHSTSPQEIGLQSFPTRAAFQSHITALQGAQPGGGLGFPWPEGGPVADVTTAAGEARFSETNVQVAGIDEADLVKTDGRYLYLADEEAVAVVRADPPEEMGIVSRISRENLVGDRNGTHHVVGLFLVQDTLVVLTSLYLGGGPVTRPVAAEFTTWMPSEGWTLVSFFSVQDPGDPTLLHEFQLSGDYRASRLKGNIVYAVLDQPLWLLEEGAYPVICEDGRCEDYEAARIYYDPEAQEGESLTNVVALDVVTGEAGYLSVLTGFTSTVYMSPANLYVTFGKWNGGAARLADDGMAWDTGTTSIYRIAVEGTELRPAAGGDVKGWLLNQFSLDEHGTHLRVATTTWGMRQVNHVYVLDDALQVVGALEGLAPGESIYSARFVGDLGYLVTFQKVDPFFVLDLSNPRRPTVLGYLKIPGFSEYLHPLDGTHVLGVGKDTIEDPSGEFAWFQGLKLSLFDVRDVRAPQEVAKYLLGERGSSSPVLYDHRAFLYIRESGLVVLPVDLWEEREGPPWDNGTVPWQGAVVLSVTPEAGFRERSRISHLPEGQASCGYGFGPYAVTRSLYIGTYLYTISATVVEAHSLGDFAEAGRLVYAEDPWGEAC